MKVFNVDMEKDLWRLLEIRVALSGTLIQDYIKSALKNALANPSFDPKSYPLDGVVFRKNIRIPHDLWSEICLDAAKRDVTRRQYLSAAIAEELKSGKLKYPVLEENLVIDAVALEPGARDDLLRATAGKLSVEELIVLFAQDLNQGDKRLINWLKEKQASLN